MIKLGCGIVAVVCLLAALVFLWQSPQFPEKLPHHLAEWAVAWFDIFRNPAAAAILLSAAFLVLVGALCLSDILMGIFLTLLATLFSLLCLLGVLGSRFDGVAKSLENLLR